MQSKIYYRRFTRMHFQPALEMLSKLKVLNSFTDNFQTFKQLDDVPLVDQKSPRLSQDKQLVQELLMKYPDLKYEPMAKKSIEERGQKSTSFNFIYNFIQFQKRLMYKGYSKVKAFEQAQQTYKQRLQRKLQQTLVSNQLAFNNEARSYLSIYEQQLQYQSRLKTLRTQRQLNKYKQKLEIMKNYQQSEPKEEDQKREPADKYRKLLYDVIESYQKDKLEEPKNKTQRLQDFQSKCNFLFQNFYNSVSNQDKINSLTDRQLLEQLIATPSKIKVQTKKLLKKLQKYNIRLDSAGQVDFSQCQNQSLKRMLIQDPNVRIALLQKDLLFQFPEREHRLLQRIELEQQIKSKRQKFPKNKTTESDENEQILKDFENLLTNELMQRSYVFFESADERLLRLQIKWMARKSQLLKLDSQEQLSKEYIQKAKKAIQKLRRLKYVLEQHRLQKTKLLFDEHALLTPALINLDKEAGYQKLIRYMQQRDEIRRLTYMDAIHDDRINAMLEIKKITQIPTSQGEQFVRENKINDIRVIDLLREDFQRMKQTLSFQLPASKKMKGPREKKKTGPQLKNERLLKDQEQQQQMRKKLKEEKIDAKSLKDQIIDI